MSAAARFGRWMAYEVAASAVQPAARVYVDTVETATRARDRVRDIYIGAEAIRQDGRRGEQTVSAGEWFHGLSDRQAAIGQLGADFSALQGDLSLHAENPADIAWVIAVAVPTLKDWQTFAARVEGNALSPWVTEWTVFEQWYERLRRLRELARSRGIQLDSPEPVELPKTIWQRGREGSGTGADAWFGLLKTVIFGAIAVTGAVGFYVVARDLHGRFRR
jgi:hypothetical protein